MQTRLINPRSLEEDQELGKGNIVRQLRVKARDEAGHLVVLEGCVLGPGSFNSWEESGQGNLVTMPLIFDTARLVLKEAAADVHFEWFLIANTRQYWRGTTRRSSKAAQKKIRVGVDAEREHDWRTGVSLTNDYFLLDVPGFRCMVAEVPRKFTGELQGLCLEFRGADIGKLDAGLLDDLKGFFSLLLGGRLYYMGFSKVAGGELCEAFMDSPDVPLKVPVAMQPIQYNLQYDWGNFAMQACRLFPKYRELREKLFLNHVMERYWIAQATPVGANLPVLAGGLEIMATEYLKMAGKNDDEYLPRQQYEDLIREELAAISDKLSEIPGGGAMLNKITGAYRKGPNEKFALFFNLVGLEIGKAEKDAIRLRNSMVHSARDYSVEDKAHDDIVSTRVYQALFNRTLLKLLGYEGYYIDYSTKGLPLKQV